MEKLEDPGEFAIINILSYQFDYPKALLGLDGAWETMSQ